MSFKLMSKFTPYIPSHTSVIKICIELVKQHVARLQHKYATIVEGVKRAINVIMRAVWGAIYLILWFSLSLYLFKEISFYMWRLTEIRLIVAISLKIYL